MNIPQILYYTLENWFDVWVKASGWKMGKLSSSPTLSVKPAG